MSFDATGHVQGGCPPGQYDAGFFQGCRQGSSYWQEQEELGRHAFSPTLVDPNTVGWCAPGYKRTPIGFGLYTDCQVDPTWKPPAGTEGDYVNVNGTLIRRSELSLPSGSPVSADSSGFAGIDSTTLLLIAGAFVLFMVMNK